MDLAGHFRCESGVDKALPLEAAPTMEGSGNDLDAKVGLAARAGACVSGMSLGLVDDFKPERIESAG
jgi:hypothetical protein